MKKCILVKIVDFNVKIFTKKCKNYCILVKIVDFYVKICRNYCILIKICRNLCKNL